MIWIDWLVKTNRLKKSTFQRKQISYNKTKKIFLIACNVQFHLHIISGRIRIRTDFMSFFC